MPVKNNANIGFEKQIWDAELVSDGDGFEDPIKQIHFLMIYIQP